MVRCQSVKADVSVSGVSTKVNYGFSLGFDGLPANGHGAAAESRLNICTANTTRGSPCRGGALEGKEVHPGVFEVRAELLSISFQIVCFPKEMAPMTVTAFYVG